MMGALLGLLAFLQPTPAIQVRETTTLHWEHDGENLTGFKVALTAPGVHANVAKVKVFGALATERSLKLHSRFELVPAGSYDVWVRAANEPLGAPAAYSNWQKVGGGPWSLTGTAPPVTAKPNEPTKQRIVQ